MKKEVRYTYEVKFRCGEIVFFNSYQFLNTNEPELNRDNEDINYLNPDELVYIKVKEKITE